LSKRSKSEKRPESDRAGNYIETFFDDVRMAKWKQVLDRAQRLKQAFVNRAIRKQAQHRLGSIADQSV
jgi:hypothetical protein